MAIVRRKQHKTNVGQKVNIKDCTRASDRGSTGGKRTKSGRMTGRSRRNGGPIVSRRRSRRGRRNEEAKEDREEKEERGY